MTTSLCVCICVIDDHYNYGHIYMYYHAYKMQIIKKSSIFKAATINLVVIIIREKKFYTIVSRIVPIMLLTSVNVS